MGKKNKKQHQAERKFQGPSSTAGATAASEAATAGSGESTNGVNGIPASGWKRAEIAYNDEGNIIILDPEIAARVRMGARADRELEIGIPRAPIDFDPESVPFEGARTGKPRIHINELCVCDYLRFHLVIEAPVVHDLLSTKPRV